MSLLLQDEERAGVKDENDTWKRGGGDRRPVSVIGQLKTGKLSWDKNYYSRIVQEIINRGVRGNSGYWGTRSNVESIGGSRACAFSGGKAP